MEQETLALATPPTPPPKLHSTSWTKAVFREPKNPIRNTVEQKTKRNCTERIAGEVRLAETSRDSWEQRRKARVMSTTHTKGATMVPSGQLCKKSLAAFNAEDFNSLHHSSRSPEREAALCTSQKELLLHFPRLRRRRLRCCHTCLQLQSFRGFARSHTSNPSSTARPRVSTSRAPEPPPLCASSSRTPEVQWFRKCMCYRSWHHGFFIRNQHQGCHRAPTS